MSEMSLYVAAYVFYQLQFTGIGIVYDAVLFRRFPFGKRILYGGFRSCFYSERGFLPEGGVVSMYFPSHSRMKRLRTAFWILKTFFLGFDTPR